MGPSQNGDGTSPRYRFTPSSPTASSTASTSASSSVCAPQYRVTSGVPNPYSLIPIPCLYNSSMRQPFLFLALAAALLTPAIQAQTADTPAPAVPACPSTATLD